MSNEFETIVTERGDSIEITKLARWELRKAKNARDAEEIFNRFAPHVARKDRGDVWTKS